MAFEQRNAANPPASVSRRPGRPSSQPLFPEDGLDALQLSVSETEIAMDAIAQLIPHLNQDDCHKVAELAQAQSTLLEIMDLRQQLWDTDLDASILQDRAA